jgi:hypothetical protein
MAVGNDDVGCFPGPWTASSAGCPSRIRFVKREYWCMARALNGANGELSARSLGRVV